MNKIVVETANLTKMYLTGGAQFYALRNVNLKVSAGEFISIVGPSGSGKSTLLNMLGALDRPTSGHVYIGGVDMFQLDSDQLAEVRNRMLGFIFQSHNLITRTLSLIHISEPTRPY